MMAKHCINWAFVVVIGAILAWYAPALAKIDPQVPAGGLWSFAHCWQVAQENSPRVGVSKLDLQEAAVGLEEADKVFYPKVSFALGATANTVEQSDLGYDLQYDLRVEPILDGYEKFLADDLSKLRYKISQKGREKSLAILRYRVSEPYLQLIAHNLAKHHLERAVMLQQRRLNLVDSTGGEQNEALRKLEARKDLILERQRLGDLDNSIDNWRLKLANAMSVAPETPVRVNVAEPVSGIIDTTVDPSGSGADWKKSIQAELGRLELELTSQQRDVADLNDLPKPLLQMGWSQGRFDEASGAYVLLGVEIPIWDWGRNDRVKKRLELRQQREELNLQERYLAWRTRLAQYRRLLADLQKRQEGLEQGMELDRQAIEILGVMMRQGEIRGDQLLTAEVELARKQAHLAVIKGKVWVTFSQIETATKMGMFDVH